MSIFRQIDVKISNKINISTNLCQYFENKSIFRQIDVNISKKFQYFAKSAQKEGSARTRGRVFSRMLRPRGTWLYIYIYVYLFCRLYYISLSRPYKICLTVFPRMLRPRGTSLYIDICYTYMYNIYIYI